MPTPKARAPPRFMWCVCDVLGFACAAATWLLVLSASALLLRDLLLPARDAAYGVAHGALFHLLAFLALAAHLRTMLTDPGALPVGAEPGPGAPRGPRCALCGAVQPPRARHCLACGRCIRGMDHHCPWVNNCVGEDNQKYFVLFALYAALAGLHVLLLLGAPALRARARGQWDLRGTVAPRGSLLFLLLVGLKGFFFGALTLGLQVYSICTDRTRGAAAWANLQDVLGRPASLAWVSPFAAPGPPRAGGRRDVV